MNLVIGYFKQSTLTILNLTTDIVVANLTGHSENMSVTCLLEFEENYLASASSDWTIKIWLTSSTIGNDGFLVKSLEGDTGVVNSVVLLSNGHLASGSQDKTIKIWNWQSGEVVKTIFEHSDSILCLTVMPNGNLATGSKNETIKLWHFSSNTKYGKNKRRL